MNIFWNELVQPYLNRSYDRNGYKTCPFLIPFHAHMHNQRQIHKIYNLFHCFFFSYCCCYCYVTVFLCWKMWTLKTKQDAYKTRDDGMMEFDKFFIVIALPLDECICNNSDVVSNHNGKIIISKYFRHAFMLI